MAINLRLTDEELAALRARAEHEGRSMNDVARDAISHYVSDRRARLDAIVDRIVDEDAELLDRLGR